MGHHIQALVARAPIDAAAAATFGLPAVAASGFVILGLDAAHTDVWAETLTLPTAAPGPLLLDCAVTHYFARQVGMIRYALMETDYVGGHGTQAAGVYDQARVVLAPERAPGSINRALRVLGVERGQHQDEFEALGLGRYRSFARFFAPDDA